MADIIDYLMIAGGTYYLMTKVKEDHDDGAKRMLLGIGAGLLVGYKGPELYTKFSDMKGTPEGQIMKDKLIASGIAAVAGYMFGDKVIGSVKKFTAKKNE